MPRVFRTMQSKGSQPLCGDDFSQLGVTVYPHESPDVTPDGEGYVQPLMGGMSVFAAIKKLPGRLIPLRLRTLFPEDFQKASGDDDLTIWCLDKEYSHSDMITNELVLSWDSAAPYRHGSIGPLSRMKIDDLQTEICSTAIRWVICEVPE